MKIVNKPTDSSDSSPHHTCIAKGDSAATHHYWHEKDMPILKHLRHAIGPSVQLPNDKFLPCNQQGEIPSSDFLTAIGKNAMISPGLKSSSLMSLGQLCDDDCTIILAKQKSFVMKNRKVIITGTRNSHDGLWDIPMSTKIQNNCTAPPSHSSLYCHPQRTSKPPKPLSTQRGNNPHRKIVNAKYNVNTTRMPHLNSVLQHQIQRDAKAFKAVNITPKNHKLNVIMRKQTTHKELVQYLHAACQSPVKSTWIKAIQNNNFVSWPGLTAKLVKKHCH